MNAETTAFPLTWPAGWKRCKTRTRAKFGKTTQSSQGSWQTRTDLSVDQATKRVLGELGRMGIARASVIVSTNIPLRNDGQPRSNYRVPDDPGAAVYWVDRGNQRCIATDRYDRIADNLAAIAATLDAMRAIERHGGAEILDRAFTGFAALPAPTAMPHRQPWRYVLNCSGCTSLEVARRAYMQMRSMKHPQNGGTTEAFDEVQKAWDQAQCELASSETNQ